MGKPRRVASWRRCSCERGRLRIGAGTYSYHGLSLDDTIVPLNKHGIRSTRVAPRDSLRFRRGLR